MLTYKAFTILLILFGAPELYPNRCPHLQRGGNLRGVQRQGPGHRRRRHLEAPGWRGLHPNRPARPLTGPGSPAC